MLRAEAAQSVEQFDKKLVLFVLPSAASLSLSDDSKELWQAGQEMREGREEGGGGWSERVGASA